MKDDGLIEEQLLRDAGAHHREGLSAPAVDKARHAALASALTLFTEERELKRERRVRFLKPVFAGACAFALLLLLVSRFSTEPESIQVASLDMSFSYDDEEVEEYLTFTEYSDAFADTMSDSFSVGMTPEQNFSLAVDYQPLVFHLSDAESMEESDDEFFDDDYWEEYDNEYETL